MDRHETVQMTDIKPMVSIIVPSYNSAQYISQCLQSLRTQVCEVSFEVILVDSSDDGTEQIVNRDFPEVKMLHYPERKFVGTARNIGIKQAKGEIIFFLDADCVAPPNWINQMYHAIQDLQADGIGGGLNNGTPFSITGTMGFYLEFFRFLAYKGIPSISSFLLGANCAFRKEVFNTIKYYDFYDEKMVGEDLFLCWQLFQKGKKLIFVPSISVTHLNKIGFLKVMHYQYKFGKGAFFYRLHTSPRITSVFMKSPYLSFLLPFLIIPWISAVVLKRKSTFEFIKFIIVLPLLFLGNSIWALGFFRQLKKVKTTIRING